jgi:hypothetical protein
MNQKNQTFTYSERKLGDILLYCNRWATQSLERFPKDYAKHLRTKCFSFRFNRPLLLKALESIRPYMTANFMPELIAGIQKARISIIKRFEKTFQNHRVYRALDYLFLEITSYQFFQRQYQTKKVIMYV